MRAFLALALLASLAAGCLGEPPASGSDMTVGGDETGAEGADSMPTREDVVFFETDYEAMPNQDATFVAEVPAGARNLRFEVLRTPSVEPSGGFTVTLEGCGYAAPQGNVVVQVPSGWSGAELCEEMAAGPADVVVQSPVVPTTGRLLLRADLPG